MPAKQELEEYRRMVTQAIADNPECRVTQNLPLVIKLAQKFIAAHPSDDVDVQELISYGNVGLVKAVDNFDPYAGFAFSTFAGRVIYNEFLRYAIDRNNHGVDIPRKTFDAVREVRDYYEENGVLPTRSVLSFALCRKKLISTTRYREIIKAWSAANQYTEYQEFSGGREDGEFDE